MRRCDPILDGKTAGESALGPTRAVVLDGSPVRNMPPESLRRRTRPAASMGRSSLPRP